MLNFAFFEFFLRNFDEIFSGFRAKLQKRVRSVAFQSILRKRIRKFPKFLKILKIIQFYSIVSLEVPGVVDLHRDEGHIDRKRDQDCGAET